MIPEELRKRLEEAADIEALKDTSKGRNRNDYYISAMADHENGFREGFITGAEHGYKEAIEVAKEWIRDRNRHACKEWLDKECADFEADMNKLWEEQK